jgi:hypothetical protein
LDFVPESKNPIYFFKTAGFDQSTLRSSTGNQKSSSTQPAPPQRLTVAYSSGQFMCRRRLDWANAANGNSANHSVNRDEPSNMIAGMDNASEAELKAEPAESPMLTASLIHASTFTSS